MDECLKEALNIVKAQASVRNMTEEELTSMVRNLSEEIRRFSCDQLAVDSNLVADLPDPTKAMKSVKEKSVVCLECGKSFKILAKRHLASHGLDLPGFFGPVNS